MAERREWRELVLPVESTVKVLFVCNTEVHSVGTDPETGDVAVVVDICQRGETLACRGVLTLDHKEAGLLARAINGTLRSLSRGN